jgi:hypothetical protein
LEQYFLEHGSQPGRIHEVFSKALLPAMERIHQGPKIFLEAVMAPRLPQVAAIFGLESCDQLWPVSKGLFSDKQFASAYGRWELDARAPAIHRSQRTDLQRDADFDLPGDGVLADPVRDPGTDSVFRAVCEKWLSVPGFRGVLCVPEFRAGPPAISWGAYLRYRKIDS